MDQVRRVIVHDKPPILEPEMFARPANRIVLAVVAASLLIQIGAVVQVVRGMGFTVLPPSTRRITVFDHTSFAVVSLLWLSLGVLVFLQRRTGRSGRLFLLSASAGSAFLSLGTLYNENIIDATLFALGLLFFPPLLVSFTRAFQEWRSFRRAELWLYLPPIILLWPSALALWHRETTVPYRVAMALVGLYMVGAIVQAIRDLLAARTTEQAAQSRALVLGLVAGTVPGVFTFVIPLVVTRSLAFPVTWIPPIILVFLIAMSYSVLLFEFSEADLIVRRGIIYGVLTLVIVVAYGVLSVLLPAGTKATSAAGGLGFVVVTLLVGAAFAPIRRAALRLVNLVLYGRRLDRWTMLQALSARLARVMQPDELAQVLVREIADALHLRGAFLLARAGQDFVLQHSVESPSRSSSRYEPIPIDLCLNASAAEAPPAAVS